MKPLKTIVPLAAVVTGIVAFWLVPNINKAKAYRYTRVYENTEETPPVVKKSKNEPGEERKKTVQQSMAAGTVEKTTVAVSKKKKYLKESIEPNRSWRKVKPRMFSRAIHFNEMEAYVDSVASDTVKMVP